MLIDLHCHSQPRSQCSSLSPDQLIALARERGLDGICMVEHDAFWPQAELAALRQRTGFLVLAGVEFTTDMGHVLAFGLSGGSGQFASAAALFEAAKVEGALLYLAHPARDGHLRVTHDTVEFFESVEAVNGSDSRIQNMAASGLARGFRLPGIGGSDAHMPAEVGRAATRFHVPVRDESEFLSALRGACYEAVTL